MYAHYTTAFLLVGLAVYHSLEMHYDWKDLPLHDGIKKEVSWWDDALKNEIYALVVTLIIIFSSSSYLYTLSEPTSTELFMWGDVGAVSDIRFYGVTPHWYFRAYMAWLIVCPHHYLGLGGLVFFFVIIYYQPNIKGSTNISKKKILITESPLLVLMNIIFFLAITYGASYLPYGKFYNRIGGNTITLVSFMYILIFMAIPTLNLDRIFTKQLSTFVKPHSIGKVYNRITTKKIKNALVKEKNDVIDLVIGTKN